MNKTIAFIVIGIVVVLIGGGFLIKQAGFLSNSGAEAVPIPEGIILFYGDGCSHCKTVDDFISQNNIEEKVSFSRLEVWYNEDNQNILTQVIQKCNIATNQVGVPFLYDGKKCLMGDADVINFFSEKIK